MSAVEFSRLPEDLQLDLLYEHGVYVGKLKLLGQKSVLYQYETFYVEILYKDYRLKIERIHYHLSTDCLDPYLEQVNTNEMIE